MQAQEFAMAKWAIGLRLSGITETDVDDAFNSGQILRTHLLRPTWHFVAPADIGWLLTLTAPRVKQANAFMDRQCGLNTALFNRTNNLIGNALGGNNHLTRDELGEVLQRNRISADGHRLSYILMRAELDGIICSGPRRGRQFTYALLDDRAPNRIRLDRSQGLAELTKRYISSRGPVTVHDFSTWSGLTVQEARAGMTMQADIDQQTIAGQTYYIKAGQSAISAPDDSQSTFLMPDYDEYGMGYKDRTAIIDPNLTRKLTYNRMVVVDGLIAGSWKRMLQGNRVLINLQMSRPLTPQEQTHVREAAERYGRFIGKVVEINPRIPLTRR